jgi:hypothetical protein
MIIAGGSFLRELPVALADDPAAFISGTVTDAQSGEPIPDVNVLIVGTHLGCASDSNGRYCIGPLEHGSFVIEFSHVSYKQVRDTVYAVPGDTVTCDVQLAKRSILLEEVEITAKYPISANLWRGTGGRVFTRKEIEGRGIRAFGDLIRFMTPGASVREIGPDVFIDLNNSYRRTTGLATRDHPQNNNPLIFLNGMRIGKSPQELNFLIKPEEIDEIVVLKGMEADMYGYEGRDGVILVNTTPQPPPTGLSLFEKLLYVSAALGAIVLVSFVRF